MISDAQDAQFEDIGTDRGLARSPPQTTITIDGGDSHSKSFANAELIPTPIPTGCCGYFSLDYYKQFFRVSQDQVYRRILSSLNPSHKTFLEDSKHNPDFYGPFWILTTLVVLISLTGNLATYLSKFELTEENVRFRFRLELVRYAGVFFYGMGVAVPATIYGLFKWMSVPVSLAQLICMYGYSLSPLIAASVACILPSAAIQWLLITYTFLNSTAFIASNLQAQLTGLQKSKLYLLYGVVGGLQLVFLLTTKSLFYKLL